MQAATVAPPMPPPGIGNEQVAIMPGAVSPGAPNTVFVPVVMQPQRQKPGLTRGQQLSMKVLGTMQVTIGAMCILISSVLVSQRGTASTDKGGAGIWCGVFFVLPGAFALAAAATNKVGWIVATMVMSILSTLMLWNVLGFSSASIDEYLRCNWYYDYWEYSRCASRAERTGYTVADGLLIALSLIELAVAIWCAAVGCQGVCCRGGCCLRCCSCCCDDPYGSQVSPQMVHYANVASPGISGEQQRVIIMSHPPAYGPGALGVTAMHHGFAGGQLMATHPTATYAQQAYGPPIYEQQLSAGASVPPNYYYSPGGGAASSWAAVQQPAATAAVQPADAEKRNLGAGPSHGF